MQRSNIVMFLIFSYHYIRASACNCFREGDDSWAISSTVQDAVGYKFIKLGSWAESELKIEMTFSIQWAELELLFGSDTGPSVLGQGARPWM